MHRAGYLEAMVEKLNQSASSAGRPAQILMIATYVVGFVGAFIGFGTVHGSAPSLNVAAILAVFATGVLSFLRHAVWSRSDAVRGGWDYGVRNNFQIEVGLANLAWGVFALLAVVLDWGLRVVAASFLISGLYFAAVALFVIVIGDFKNRRVGGLIGIAVWAAIMIALGVMGMSAS